MISIIMPTFNRAHIIMESIQSVLQQSYSDFELIVVDDCSTDDTKEVIHRIGDSRIRYYKNPRNMGAAASRNVGIEKSSCALIAFQDSDDIWDKDKIKKQVQYFSEHPEVSMVYCRFLYHNAESEIIIPSAMLQKEQLEGNIFNQLLEGNLIGTPTMLVRKECLDQVGYFDENLKALEDWELALRIAKEYRIGFVKECLMNSWEKETGVNLNRKNLLEAQIYIIKKYGKEQLSRKYLGKSILVLLESVVKYCSEEEQNNYTQQLVPTIFSRQEECDLLLMSIRKNYKFKENYNIATKILMTDDMTDKLREICEKKGWTKIAIYGCGKIGKVLLKVLLEANIEILYMIDQKETKVNDVNVRKLEEVDDSPHVIFVTTVEKYNLIKSRIAQFTTSDICYVGDLF